ncbi:MAG: 4Fe-4S dicluster domain-containing protein [Anaerolineales bacterium]
MSSTADTLGELSLPKSQLDLLLTRLQQRGYQVLGPRSRHGTIEYGPIERTADLPVGLESDQAPGSFRLRPGADDRVFDAIPGADSWRKFLFPARNPLFRVERNDGANALIPFPVEEPQLAFIGVRACELAAIAITDKVFQHPGATDPIYQARRRDLFVMAIDCHAPAATCFCDSMGTGPRAEAGFDLALSELDESYLVRVGSQVGASVIADLRLQPADEAERTEAKTAVERARSAMTRRIPTEGLPERLLTNLNHPRWEQVAGRCLNCTNCTLVCPTCFCWDVADDELWTADASQRVRTWDSCFNPDHSYHAGGGATRPTVRSRYRQWLTHKFASWVGQFGVSGCVGCGRCITWCPAKIDVTEEITAIVSGEAQ